MKLLPAACIMLLHLVTGLYGQPTPLQLYAKNPHYFLYKNKPTLLIGSGEHYGSVINLDFDYKTYLETLGKDGLNTTRLFTGAYIEKQGDFGIAKNTLAPAPGRLLLPWQRSGEAGFALGGNKFDLGKWDEAYFKRLKDFIKEANRNNVIVEVNLFSSYYGGGWQYSPLNPKNNINHTDSLASIKVNTLENGNILPFQKQYVQKVVAELNNFDNLYFEIQNEPWADQTDTVLVRNEYSEAGEWRSTIQVVSKLSDAWQRQVTQWIKETEAGLSKKHLISQNISNFHFPISNPDPNISIFNFHYSLPEAVTENYHLNKVIGFNETGFAGKADKTYRRQAWRFVMAGGGLFNQLDYSFSAGSEKGTDTSYIAPGGGSPTLRKELGVLTRLMDSQSLIDLQPDKTAVKASPGAWTETLSNDNATWIIYYEPMSSKPGTLKLNLPAGNYQAEWMSTTSGQVIKKITQGITNIEVPAGNEDKVLILKAIAGRKK